MTKAEQVQERIIAAFEGNDYDTLPLNEKLEISTRLLLGMLARSANEEQWTFDQFEGMLDLVNKHAKELMYLIYK